MACAFVGDTLGYRHPGKKIRPFATYDERRVVEVAIALNLIAFLASVLLQLAYSEEIARRSHDPGGMSGPMVIVIFFTAVHRYSFALALLLFWRRKTALAFVLAMMSAAVYLLSLVAFARRGPAMEFIFICLLTYALGRKKAIPAALITVVFVGGTLWSGVITDFRIQDDRGFLEKVSEADYIKRFMDMIDHGDAEVRTGCVTIWSTHETEQYEYGKIHWNKLVHAYFPGQIFGHDLKESLKFEIEDFADEYVRRRGTLGMTHTGMADCFTSFWYFGCLKYLLIGFVMGRWFRRAFLGDLAAQLAYSTLITGALHTISHGTPWLLNDFIHMAIFSYPLLYWARKPAAVIDRSIIRRPRPTVPAHEWAPTGVR
jgi:hypothetical protein